MEEKTPYRRRLRVKASGRLVILRTAEIERIEAASNNVILHSPRGRFVRRGTLADLEASLDPREFVRTHRSHLVRVELIQEIVPRAGRGHLVVLKTGARVPLGRRFRARFEALLP
jgi:two-component system LytT family response regulator